MNQPCLYDFVRGGVGDVLTLKYDASALFFNQI